MSKESRRKVDGVGRIVIPADFRRQAGLGPGARYTTRLEGDKVIVQSAEDTCESCGQPKPAA